MLSTFVLAVSRLARQNVLVPAIAAELRCTEADVMEALRMLAGSLPHEPEPPAVRAPAGAK